MTQWVPSGILIRLTKPTTGIRSKKALFHLPLKKGTSNPPTINMTAGGTALVIVVLSSLHEGAKDVFCGNNQNHTGHKSIYGIKLQPPFPWEMGMFVDKELDDEQNNQRREKTLQESVDVLWLVKKIGLFVLALFFHIDLLLWRA
jgi:hypothetical protein